MCYWLPRRTKGGDPVPMRQSEVNRMLGKVDELAVKMRKLNSLLCWRNC